jgi:hypothetical protein
VLRAGGNPLADIYYLTNKLVIHIEKINSLIDKKIK